MLMAMFRTIVVEISFLVQLLGNSQRTAKMTCGCGFTLRGDSRACGLCSPFFNRVGRQVEALLPCRRLGIRRPCLKSRLGQALEATCLADVR